MKASVVTLVCLLAAPISALAAAERPATETSAAPGATTSDDGIITDGVDITERLGEKAAIDAPFVDQDGKVVRLRDYMGKRPVIVAMVYYRCPVLCGLLLQGLTKVLRELDWLAGREFDVLTISVDPMETPELAKEKRNGFLQALGKQGTQGAWPFLTGTAETIDFVAGSLGFKFKYVERERQFAHIAALFFLSPNGTITRYLYGVNFKPDEVKLALFESADGRVGTTLERVLLRCYKFDPASRRYHTFIRAYYRIWGAIILACMATFLGILWRRELRRKHGAPGEPKGTA